MDGGKTAAVHDLRTLFEVGSLGGMSDGHLLGRFVSRREEAVFEAIVQRHGPMVWGVCRRLLRDHHDAEDAFQVTFLVLARKAPSVAVREKLGNWLYGVAYQTAMKARTIRARRRMREGQVTDMREPEAVPHPPQNELSEWFDRELSRLPEKYRIPIVLCELEGKTHRDVAEQLGWPIGTVSGRLSRAKAMLAKRLTRRGVALSMGSLAVVLAQEALATMPSNLIGPTANATTLYAAGDDVAANVVSGKVAALIREVLKTMFFTKLKLGVAVLLVALVATSGSLWMASKAATADLESGESKPTTPTTNPARADAEQLQGVWVLVRLDQVDHRPTEAEKALLKTGGHTITIKNNIIIHNVNNDLSAVYFALDSSHTPRRITLEMTNGPDKGRKIPAIYRLDGDDLMICQGRPGDREPPTGFSIEDRRPGTAPMLFVYKRRPGPQAADTRSVDGHRRPSQAETPQDAGVGSLPGAPNSTFGGGADGTFYQRRGALFFVRYPLGNRFSIYNAVTNKASTIQLPGTKDAPLEVVPIIGGGNLISLSLKGSNLRRLFVFSLTDWTWYSQDIQEPVTGELHLMLGSSIACYAQGRFIYAFSAQVQRWSILNLPQDAPVQPRVGVQSDSVVVEYDGHVYEFSGKTGKWVHTDLRSVINAAIKAAEDEAK